MRRAEEASRGLPRAAFTYFDTDRAKPALLERFQVAPRVAEVQLRTGEGRPWRVLRRRGSGDGFVSAGAIERAYEEVVRQTEPVVVVEVD